MLVSELSTRLAERREIATEVGVATLAVDSVASRLSVGEQEYALDEGVEKSLAGFLGIPAGYVKKLAPTFKAQTIKYWLDEYSDADVRIFTRGEQITAIGSADIVSIPTDAVGEVITNVFAPGDRVDFYRGTDYAQFDVVTQAHQVEVLNPDDVLFRPQVGDITYGGERFVLHPYTAKPPSAMAYFERLVCTNGMCTEEKLGRINIQGNTVPEIIAELEAKARQLLGNLDDGLAAYAATARKPVPGTLAAFAAQLAREYGFTRGVLDEVLAIINQLGPNATVYDVLQAFTSVANRVESTPVKHKLQTLGGSLALEADKVLRRCTSCERLL